MTQVLEQPSPLVVLPSSQFSPNSMTPLPHVEEAGPSPKIGRSGSPLPAPPSSPAAPPLPPCASTPVPAIPVESSAVLAQPTPRTRTLNANVQPRTRCGPDRRPKVVSFRNEPGGRRAPRQGSITSVNFNRLSQRCNGGCVVCGLFFAAAAIPRGPGTSHDTSPEWCGTS